MGEICVRATFRMSLATFRRIVRQPGATANERVCVLRHRSFASDVTGADEDAVSGLRTRIHTHARTHAHTLFGGVAQWLDVGL